MTGPTPWRASSAGACVLSSAMICRSSPRASSFSASQRLPRLAIARRAGSDGSSPALARPKLALRGRPSCCRSSPTNPSRSFGIAVASPASTARAAFSASTGSLLPRRRRDGPGS